RRMDRVRSLDVADLAPLAGVGGVDFVSLQMGPGAAQAGRMPFPLIDLTGGIGDFADTAALIANLDLVIGCDTSVIHLAGALGGPVWLLHRANGCWRWLLRRADSPWYPNLRLFRQERPRDWRPVIERVAEALNDKKAGPPR
ncbi:MAG: glycosyltransferase, partial [Alphaproteobacteria bacterium]|nr:glycosyltransferase [Alphaproteobacteria bacterium]